MKQNTAPIKDCIALLKKLLRKTEASLKNAPKGYLKIYHVNGGVYYCVRMPGKGRTARYTNDMTEVRALAQKSYDEKARRVLEKQLRAAEKILVLAGSHFITDPDLPPADQFSLPFPYLELDALCDSLLPERQELIIPVVPTTAQYVRDWLETEYEGKEFRAGDRSAYYTLRHERVRSKSEILIANALFRAGIPYKYECPLWIGDKVLYPDFTILDIRTRQEVYYEHCGMMDDPEYLNGFLWKISYYRANGIFPGEKLILTFESREQPLDTRSIEKIIDHYFQRNETPAAVDKKTKQRQSVRKKRLQSAKT